MSEFSERYIQTFYRVSNPAQYAGAEWNSVRKAAGRATVRVALAFPETYAIGMSHLGIQILYSIINAREDAAAERVFAPWVDMAGELRSRGLPLLTLESNAPVKAFDIVGFSLQDEVTYTNVLEMLDLAGIPIRSSDRSDGDPLVVAGGPCALSPEPMADFIDLFVLGDGEEEIGKLIDAFAEARAGGLRRRDMLIHLARSSRAFYIPSLYQVTYGDDGRLQEIRPSVEGVPATLMRAVVALSDALAPTVPIVPNAEAVHDRITVEIMRGCTWGCRFCHAGMTKRPVRWRPASQVMEIAEESYRNTGHEEISLTSLTSSDYPELGCLLPEIAARFKSRRVNISLPSLRVGPQLEMVADALSEVRKTGLTIALEAATERLRRVINKDIPIPELFKGLKQAYSRGWRLVKLYFMVGLPGETDEDVDAIVGFAREISDLRREVSRGRADVNVTVAPFVPKAHTPFQWEPMASLEKFQEIKERLLGKARGTRVKLKFHHIERSFLEAVLSRGDRRVGRAIEAAWRRGSVFDGWDEHFDFGRWLAAFREAEIDPAEFALRERGRDEVFPWDHIDAGPRKDFLWQEHERARAAILTQSCFQGTCSACGACEEIPDLGGHGLTPMRLCV